MLGASPAVLLLYNIQGTVRHWNNKHGGGLIRDFDGLWRQMLLPHGERGGAQGAPGANGMQ